MFFRIVTSLSSHIFSLIFTFFETIFSYKLKENDVPVQWLNSQWHYFYDRELHIPEDTKIVHTINKEFDYVWRFEKKINL